ncbi:hypothetical protein MKW94_024949 [Papaver nudicaule]|uniref:Stress-response A/B barrel domain-containing protein n=1 Tax=Papaver nudicaule TaxID=74823 RepID=A0AA42B5G8_PAPNU|nr:hypothetical protein [Papaver nudicaule]
MGDLKHIVVAKFKEGVIVDELVEGMEKMVLDIQAVEYIECSFSFVTFFTMLHLSHSNPLNGNMGHDIESNDMLTQAYTHVFSMTFRNSEDLTAYLGHPSHVSFSTTFSEAIEKILLFDFPVVIVKASTSLKKNT